MNDDEDLLEEVVDVGGSCPKSLERPKDELGMALMYREHVERTWQYCRGKRGGEGVHSVRTRSMRGGGLDLHGKCTPTPAKGRTETGGISKAGCFQPTTPNV